MTANDDPNHPYWERPRNGNGRFQRTIRTVRRDAAAAEYQADHPDATLDDIAREFGYCHRSDARKAILRARAEVARPAVDKLIAVEMQELDALYAEVLEILQTNHVVVSQGRIVYSEDGTPLPDDEMKLKAIDRAIKARESFRKLLGLDAPSRVSVDAEQLGRDISKLLDTALDDDDA